ncbi:thermonuclease family protein [Afifella sp. IM 167]|uniref:thermonuclease family protein n=1 Tax=Afifella sp. IM 167 TaxID=2033586 RepID=UPI001CCA3B44|nr:thermonuclease family protein [Afifella sp. IM 167]
MRSASLAGIALLAALLAALLGLTGLDPATTDRTAESDAPAGTATPAESKPEVVPPASRDVTPRGFTHGPVVTGPLLRVAPTPSPPEPEPDFDGPVRALKSPVPLDAETLREGRQDIALYGIKGVPIRLGCGKPVWPCGTMARTALRRLVKSGTVECVVPEDKAGAQQKTVCRVAGVDVGEWMVRQGWARSRSARYETAEKEAQDARRGMWSRKRPRFISGKGLPEATGEAEAKGPA